MKTRNQYNDRKKQTIVITTLVAILLFITGTFAWRDYSQHKTNVLTGKGMTRDVVLVEDFEGPVKDWKEGQSVGKKISVRNKGEGDAYVRLKIKEYMEVGNSDSKYSNLRYLIDNKGNYISAKFKEDATNEDIVKAMNNAIDAANDPSIKEIIGELTEEDIAENYDQLSDELKRIHRVDDQDGTIRYYIATRKEDPNGQYGKHIAIDKDTLGSEANPEDIITGGGTEKKRPDASIEHHEGNLTIDQCELFDHIDYEKRPEQNKASKYVELGYGSVITNLANDGDNGKWLYDNTSGYFYYTKPLSSKEENPTTGASLSEDLLESLKLIVRPEGAFIYEFHVDLEAVSWDEIDDGQWDTDIIPESLYSKWNSNSGHGEVIEEDGLKKVILETTEGPIPFLVMFEDDEALYLLSENYISYEGKNKSQYQSSGDYVAYEESMLKKYIDGWFNDVLSEKSRDIVLPSVREGMGGLPSTENHQGALPDNYFPEYKEVLGYRNKVDRDSNNVQMAFAPSISDINFSKNHKGLTDEDWFNYKSKIEVKQWQTSSPGDDSTSVAMVTPSGIHKDTGSMPNSVRIAMWIRRPK